MSSASGTGGTTDWARLARPDAFPEEPGTAQVEWIQTHLSHVFLTAARVYKFRKPVDLGFVRFTSREERNRDCLREVALNQRLAPDVYLGVAPLLGPLDRPRIGLSAETLSAANLEHLSDSWPVYSGDYSGRRFSSLKEVDRSSVKNLALAWVARLTAGTGAGPIPVAAGGPPGAVAALREQAVRRNRPVRR